LQNECSINVHISPGARKNQVIGITFDGEVKIKISALPVEGKANIALVKYLSGVLSIPISRINIERGEKSHNKKVRISGLTLEEASERFNLAAREKIN
jgi:uncharacterized protein